MKNKDFTCDFCDKEFDRNEMYNFGIMKKDPTHIVDFGGKPYDQLSFTYDVCPDCAKRMKIYLKNIHASCGVPSQDNEE